MTSNLSSALYVVRLRHKPLGVSFRIGQRWTWRHAVVADRVRDQARVPKPLKFFHQPPWLPPEGRESPREDWMGWRRFMNRYAYPGYVGMKLALIALDARSPYGWKAPRRALYVPSCWAQRAAAGARP